VGETTLLNAVMGLLPVRAGRAVLDGRDLCRAAPHDRALAGVAYVPRETRCSPT
jgi:urea transport system ATP-binding protein